jgi:hypothetical protein
MNVTPHVAQNTAGRRRAIDGRAMNCDGYRVSQQRRKRIEEFFGGLKTVAGQRKTKYRAETGSRDPRNPLPCLEFPQINIPTALAQGGKAIVRFPEF